MDKVTKTPSETPSYLLSPLDHLALRVHVPKLLYFKTSTQKPKEICKTLKDALDKTLKIIPILAGTLRYEDGIVRKGTLSVGKPYYTASRLLWVSDHGNTYNYEELEAKHFPPDGVSWGAVISSTDASWTPVLLTKVNIIRSGVILFVGVHHCVMDEVGIVNFLKVWSTFCRGGDSGPLVKKEWFVRLPLKRGKGEGKPEDHPQYTIAPDHPGGAPLLDTTSLFVPKETVQTAIIFFTDAALAALKGLVLESIVSSQQNSDQLPPEWISTNDALCAFLWVSVSTARLSAEPSPESDAMSTFRMTMDFRSRMKPPMSAEYCGNLVMTAFANAKVSSTGEEIPEDRTSSTSTQVMESLHRSNLATAALTIRASYDAMTSDTVYDIIQMVNNLPDLHRCKPTGGYKSRNVHLALTSWARQPYYDMDWGTALGGQCQRLRARNGKTDGCLAIFPRIPDGVGLGPGGIEVLLPLERSHLLWLKKYETFNKYAEWRCVAGEPLEEPSQGQAALVEKMKKLGSWMFK